jgi:hypothetical protein
VEIIATGGVILVFLLPWRRDSVTPALRARGRKQRDDVTETARGRISRLEDHRKRKAQSADDKADR